MRPTLGTRTVRPAGRDRELHLLDEAVQGVSEGRPSALFVHGEAGVGKTSLVAQVCADAEARGDTVLWGRCVHFGAATSPYAPLLNALEAWRLGHPTGELPGDLDGLLRTPVADEAVAGRMLPRLERLLTEIAAGSPTILVVDDLQWADVTSLDLLAYLVAGFHRQRLAVIVTYRDVGLEDGHPLHGWLADLVRMPAVHDVPLQRLAEDDTAEQVAQLLGGPPDEQLVSQVHARSGGNPYLTELLVQNLAPGAVRLPRGLPDRLRRVLLASWHSLTPQTRQTMRILAVGGQPLEYDELLQVAEKVGLDPAGIPASLAEAGAAGVMMQADASNRYWFRHPLLAEVLSDSFPPGEGVAFHEAFISVLESGTPRDEVGLIRHLAILSLHHEQCGNADAAFTYLLEAADHARHAQGYPEEARHLNRLVELSASTSEQALQRAGGRIALLERAAVAARNCGDIGVAYGLVTRALHEVRRTDHPLTASRLLLMWTEMAFHTSTALSMPLAQVMEAVELSSGAPDSEEHAIALASLSHSEAWNSMPAQAARHAEQAVAAAERSGSATAMSLALGARSFIHIRDERGVEDGEAAYAWARRSGDAFYMALAAIDRSNYLAERGRLTEDLAVESEAFAFSTAAGNRGFAAHFAATAALTLLQLGRIAEARDWVRECLAARSPGSGGLFARRAAATLAIRTGRLEEADEHLQRMAEMQPEFVDRLGLQAPTIVAEHALAHGRPVGALEMLRRAVPRHGAVDPRYADELLVWGARAAADAARQAADLSDDSACARARQMLDELVELRRACAGQPFETVDDGDAVQPALQLLFEAESARCRDAADAPLQWEAAVLGCRDAGLRWDEAVAGWRWAQALLAAGAPRDVAARVVRETHTLATEIGATPLVEEVQALARSARIPLGAPEVPAQGTGGARAGALTAREREVMAHLVAGRSYAEIAEALGISQKTVSVHVSNLLRKTGSRNRAEAADFARRHGLAQTDAPPT